ncbi:MULTISPECIES: TonB-dependent receptor [unclassified Azospirillum]|uniref:TonB-dependent receptor n=1 Tax=unclassified Azospirillum TaxID=2630922 RepID=UPI000B68246B|nr:MULTISPECIES: TonB-dependent receptor [unclassified Azospirillum]SNS81922.1 iron complex outermembrane recepter protein [Azospirillum sp. RU38E]SNS99029.1 iron complex outermembrane recepter protein [Azospirillum sp. RU37A]
MSSAYPATRPIARISGAFILCASASLLALSCAQAQDVLVQTADAAGGVEEIIVTAERRAADLQKTAIAISAFSATRLEERDTRSIRDLAGQIPNFNVARVTIGYTTQTFSLRGIGEADPISEPAVSVYVDDVYIPRQIGSMTDFNDVERVEVLRGPQGTLYGRNSSAGALRVITRQPDNDAHVAAELSAGNYGAVQGRATVSGPLVQDKLYASLSYLHNSRDGVTYNATLGKDVNNIDVNAVRLKLRATPTEKLDIDLTLDYLRDRSDTRGYVPVNQPGGFNPYRTYSEVEPYNKLDQGGGSLRATYALSDELSLKSITAYRGFNQPVDYENDGTAALIQKNLITYNDQYATQEFQLNGDYEKFSFTTGAFYLYERFDVERDGFTRQGPLATSSIRREGAYNITKTNSAALFGQATWHATDRLNLTAGLRFTREKKNFSFDNKLIDANRRIIGQSIAGDATRRWNSLTPKLTVEYQATDSALVYATYAQGFKAGGFDNRATLVVDAERGFDPEKVKNYEAGIKADWLDKRLRTNLAAFYNDYTDLQVSAYDPDVFRSRRGNAASAETYGVELELEARLLESLSWQASAGWLHAKYQDYKGAGGNGVNADGNDLPTAPRLSLSSSVTWTISDDLSGGTLTGNLNGQYQTKNYASALNRLQEKIPNQGYLNAGINWAQNGGPWSLGATVKNLTDEDHVVGVGYTPAVGIHYVNIADPRTWLVTLRYRL